MSKRTSIFGVNIDLPPVSTADHVEEICVQAVKKKEERLILQQFLGSVGLSGRGRLDEINGEIATAEKVDDENIKQQACEHYLAKLKKARINDGNGLSMYTYLMLEYVEKTTTGKVREYAHKFKTFNNAGSMPMMADNLRKAEGIILAKLKSDIGEKHCRSFLKEKRLKSKIREISKDLFYGVNAGLNPEQVKVFMSVMFELQKLETATPTNAKIMREHILRAIKGEPLEIIHLKCPRYAYPKGKIFELLEHSEACQVIEEGDKPFVIPDETGLFTRLSFLCEIFNRHKLKITCRALLMDQDVLDHVFDGKNMGISETVKIKLEKYRENLTQKLPFFDVYFLRDFLDEQGLLNYFDDVRKQNIRKLYAGSSSYPERFIEDQVEYRVGRNKFLMNREMGYQFARDQVYAKLATLQAIGALRSKASGERNYFMVEEDRGNENSFIGGIRNQALSVFFMKLRDNPL